MILTGNFKTFSWFILIIIFHELGHVLASLYFNWKIEKICILPFGGITIFNEDINKPLKEELIICISGPLFQMFFYLLTQNFVDISNIHYNLLIFNLLPIVPLDGSKLLNVTLNNFFPYKTCLYLSNIISIVSIFSLIILFAQKNNLLLVLIVLFLIYKVILEFKNINYIFNRFLLERYFKRYNFKKIIKIRGNKLTKMYLNCNHLFYINNKYYTEREIIKKRFDLQGKI